MKGIGKMISDKEKALKDIQTTILISDILKWEKLMVREYIHGVTARSMMVNGIKVLNMVMGYGED